MVEIRNIKQFNEEKFLSDLQCQHWEYVYFFATNPNDMWEIWKELFLQILNKHAPVQHKRFRSKKVPWLKSAIKDLIHNRDKLKRKTIAFHCFRRRWS